MSSIAKTSPISASQLRGRDPVYSGQWSERFQPRASRSSRRRPGSRTGPPGSSAQRAERRPAFSQPFRLRHREVVGQTQGGDRCAVWPWAEISQAVGLNSTDLSDDIVCAAISRTKRSSGAIPLRFASRLTVATGSGTRAYCSLRGPCHRLPRHLPSAPPNSELATRCI